MRSHTRTTLFATLIALICAGVVVINVFSRSTAH